jgi:hypothetical protein
LATGTSCSPTAAGSTTCFVVTNSGGVTATTQNGSGTVLPPQNPVLVVAGP